MEGQRVGVADLRERDPLVRQDQLEIESERTKLGSVAAGAHLQDHEQSGDRIVGVDKEARRA